VPSSLAVIPLKNTAIKKALQRLVAKFLAIPLGADDLHCLHSLLSLEVIHGSRCMMFGARRLLEIDARSELTAPQKMTLARGNRQAKNSCGESAMSKEHSRRKSVS
jgi:hypothetical protein